MTNILKDLYEERFGADGLDDDEDQDLVYDVFDDDPDNPEGQNDPNCPKAGIHIEKPCHRSKDVIDPMRRKLVDRLGLFAA